MAGPQRGSRIIMAVNASPFRFSLHVTSEDVIEEMKKLHREHAGPGKRSSIYKTTNSQVILRLWKRTDKLYKKQ